MITGSKDLAEVTALYETGEIGTYTALVDTAAAAAEAVRVLREDANSYWGRLLESGENPAQGVAPYVYEIAAGEFVDLANFGIEDCYTAGPPTPAGWAALYITNTDTAYAKLAATAEDVYKNLAKVGRRALICADAWAGVNPAIAAAYEELAGRLAAELGEYTYGNTRMVDVRAQLDAA